MLEKIKTYYTYNDIALMPAVISNIEHRQECKPYNQEGMLPLFTAPMSTVVSEKNFHLFEEQKINAILPRNIVFSTRLKYATEGKWAAFSLSEFKKYFCDHNNTYDKSENIKVLIDIANGHLHSLYEQVEQSKSIFGERIKIMVGNIANANTYTEAYRSGVDYIRVGIGGGCGCITSSNTSIHVPMASLIDEINDIKSHLRNSGVCEEKLPKIIADGGIRNYNDIIKALALGADYVMIGSVFAKALESAGIMTAYIPNELNKGDFVKIIVTPNQLEYNEETKTYYYKGTAISKLTKSFYGMASVKGQEDLYGKKIKTSEGIEKELNVEYTLQGWTNNFIDFLRSAMSYTNSRNLLELRQSKIIILSNNAFNAINR